MVTESCCHMGVVVFFFPDITCPTTRLHSLYFHPPYPKIHNTTCPTAGTGTLTPLCSNQTCALANNEETYICFLLWKPSHQMKTVWLMQLFHPLIWTTWITLCVIPFCGYSIKFYVCSKGEFYLVRNFCCVRDRLFRSAGRGT